MNEPLMRSFEAVPAFTLERKLIHVAVGKKRAKQIVRVFAWVKGRLGCHPRIDVGARDWTVTHLPTGVALRPSSWLGGMSPRDAAFLVERLGDDPLMDFSLDDFLDAEWRSDSAPQFRHAFYQALAVELPDPDLLPHDLAQAKAMDAPLLTEQLDDAE